MRKILLYAVISMVSITAKAQLAAGIMAPEISLPNVNDSVINLSSFKGKVVLIDFWASWCGPCRAAIPAVKRLYKKYNEKGFEVFGISIDAKKQMWLQAINEDKIVYSQVNDNTGWNSKIAELYRVDAIPATFLLDRTGKIVAVDAEGAKLEKKIKALLK